MKREREMREAAAKLAEPVRPEFVRKRRSLSAEAAKREAAQKAYLERPAPVPAAVVRHQGARGGGGRQQYMEEQKQREMAKHSQLQERIKQQQAIASQKRQEQRERQMAAMAKRGVTGLQSSAELAKRQQEGIAGFWERSSVGGAP